MGYVAVGETLVPWLPVVGAACDLCSASGQRVGPEQAGVSRGTSLPSASNGSGNHSTKLLLAVLSLNVNFIVISSITFIFKL